MKRIRISAEGVLLLAALYFLLTLDEFMALMLACAAHELGHIAAIRLTGGRVSSLTANATGAVIARSASRSRTAEIVCAAAGPIAGLIYAAFASGLGSDMLLLSAGLSLALSAYNALPALPLDGGRILECIAGHRAAALCSLVTAAGVLLLGTVLAAGGYGIALVIAGAALLWQQRGV